MLSLVPGSENATRAQASALVGELGERVRFSVYEPLAAFDLVEELDFLTGRAIERNVFFTPQFLVPAMPRLDDRSLRLLVARDGEPGRDRLRMLLPFSVENAGALGGGQKVVRTWTHPFGPRGTLPLDHDDPARMLSNLFDALRDPTLDLPPVLVVPDLWLGGPVVAHLQREVERRGLLAKIVDTRSRAALDARVGRVDVLGELLSPKRRRELGRQRRLLEARGALTFECAREPAAVRSALDDFLALEASGWKGRARSAMLTDRYRAAFAREAVNACAEKGRARIYTLRLDTLPVASVVVLSSGGDAVLWKTAYDERHADASPGFQLMARVTQALVADHDIVSVDSCAVPDHSLMSHLWRERVEIGTMVIGLRPGAKREMERAATGLRRTRELQQARWRLRRAVARLFPRKRER